MTDSRIAVFLTLALSSLSCAGPSAAPSRTPETSSPVAGTEGIAIGDLDRRVDACTDFFGFANGGWLAANPIPAGMPRWSKRLVARDVNRHRLQTLLEEIAAKPGWPARSVDQIVGDTYASCMNEAQIAADGLRPLASLLGAIDGARDMTGVQRAIRRLHDVAVPAAFTLSAAYDYHQPTHVVASLAPGTLGLPDRDAYLKSDPHADELRARYRRHVARLLQLRGFDEARAREAADAIFALEKRLAEAALDGAAAADPTATDHKTTFTALEELAPSFDWATYFDEARLPRATLNVAEPRYLQELDKELHETPVATWKLYLSLQLLESAAPFLAEPFAAESYDWKDRALGGAAERKPRAMRCAEATEALLGDAVGRRYVERYFPAAAQAKVMAMAENLLVTLKEDVAAVAWMSPETRQRALEKLATYEIQMGFPKKWKNQSSLLVRRDTLWANVATARRFNVDEDRQRVGKPADRDLWQLPASSPDGYLDLQLNEIVLPAGFLEARGFRIEATDAVTYGLIGVGLAHDMTHAIDSTGADLDGLGRPGGWWSAGDREAYQQRAACIIDQYDRYFVEPGLHVQGKAVSTEAVADLGGMRIAFRALERSLATNPVPTRDGFTPEQQFFIAWAQLRGEALRPETERQLTKADPHPIGRFQVLGTLADTPEFESAFSCKPGASMMRPPEKRCAVW